MLENPIIQVMHATRKFKETKALNDINISFKKVRYMG